MRPYRPLRRVDLFLVRVWCENPWEVEYDSGQKQMAASYDCGDGIVEWRGSVQRVVDGESHQFKGWQGLTDLLLEMVSKKEGR